MANTLNLRHILNWIYKITKAQSSIKFDDLDQSALKTGLAVSYQALHQPEDVALTPYMANALKQLDKKDELKVGDDATKMEEYLERETELLLNKYCGKEIVHYDPEWSPDDQRNYNVDCWRNFKRGSGIRHAIPKMNQIREKNFSKFYKPFKGEWSFEHSYKLHRSEWEKVLKLLDRMVPDVWSSSHWMEVNLPFMTKHTNVGYPYFRNDKSLVPGKKVTYAKLTSDQARKMKPKDVVNFPFIAFGRNLRGKARPILGGSRLQALVFNQLEAKEIESYKLKSPLFIGYNNEEVLRDKMIKLAHWLSRNKDYTVWNRDYNAFDTTVQPGLRRLVDAISILKTNDSRGKDIAFWRGVSHHKNLLVNGLIGKVIPVYARIYSGEIDTNRGGGLVNAIADMIVIQSQDPRWSEVALDVLEHKTSPLWVMGDDNLLVQSRKVNNEEYSRRIKNWFGLDVSSEKGEYGLFFLQRRLFKTGNGDFKFITPFTRVIRSLATKESRKGLGPAGWTIASYMLLHQLIEWPELMVDVAKIFAKFDKFKLGTVWTVKQMTQLVAKEDREALQKDKKAKTTYDRLYDGDPLKQGYFNEDGSINESFLSKIHTILVKGLRSGVK